MYCQCQKILLALPFVLNAQQIDDIRRRQNLIDVVGNGDA